VSDELPITDLPPGEQHGCGGYHGRYLRIDLSARRACVLPIPGDVLRQYIGGSGLGAWLLLQQTPGEDPIDPLAPDAPIVICFSPLVGTPLTTSAKFAMVAKSPLTQRINDSLSSSAFAIAGKKTGYDAFVILGAAPSPVTLVIEPDVARLLDASAEWGHSASETADRLRERLGPAFRTAAIGPAGERLVRFATVSNDGRHAGRGGLGAVWGSKYLKALAVRGDRSAPVVDPLRLADYAKDLSARSFGPATAKYRELGTVSNLLTFNRLGTLPTRNFQQSTFAAAVDLAPETVAAQFPRTRASCAACSIGCEHIFQLPGGTASEEPDLPSPDKSSSVRMEYENLFALGPLCGVSDPQAVLAASRTCDELGLDTISAGGTIAFAMECAERGLLEAPALRFGSADAVLHTLELIARRESLGDLLADGVRAAAERIGHGAAAFAVHVKGLELPGYEPRALQTMALGFAVGTRGADHNRSGAYQVDFSERVDRFAPDDSAVARAIETEDEAAVMDALILCKFLRGVFNDRFAAMAEMLTLVTGWDVSAAELRETARRIITAKKQYNITQGWTPDEDRLPDRFHEQPLPDGPGAGTVISRERLADLVRQYYSARGWTREGYVPSESRPPAVR
jgi:aldehyde:ferredoxin oxidoreductase